MDELKIPRMATIAKTAKITGVPEYFVRQKVINGEVVAVCAGRKYLVNVDKFVDFLNGDDSIKTSVTTENTANDGRIQPIPLRLR